MTTLRFRILGERWRLRLLPRKRFRRKHGKCLAVTMGWKRTIDLSPKGHDRETIVHELLHAFASECCIRSMNVDTDNYEEFLAELVSKRGKRLLELADTLRQRVREADAKPTKKVK